jgi:hypothetical protein
VVSKSARVSAGIHFKLVHEFRVREGVFVKKQI